ncbi:MAG TPA: TolC family protein [Nitrospira sp.]|nr:TolC family protein [Nitrospira sp.]
MNRVGRRGLGLSLAVALMRTTMSYADALAPPAPQAFLSMSTAVQVGLAYHPLIRRAGETANAAAAAVGQAEARYYPWLDAYGIGTGGTIRPLSRFNISGAQNKPTSYVENAGFLADQLIYDFGQTSHRVQAERYGEQAAQDEIAMRKATVITEIKQAYIRCLRQQRLANLTEDMVRQRGMLKDQIATLYKNQLKSKIDLNLMTVELRAVEAQLIQVKNDLQVAFAQLNAAMGLQSSAAYTLDEPSYVTREGTLDELIGRALEDRPELHSQEKRISQADERVQAAHALHYPTISAMGMSGVIHFSDAPLNQYGGAHVGQTNLWWGAAATVSIPIFTGFLLENRTAEAKQDRYKAERHQQDVSNRVRMEVAEAYFTIQTAKQEIGVAENEVRAARSAWELASGRYRMGLASVVDVTTAATALLAAEVNLADARYGAQIAAVALDFAIGATDSASYE